MFGGLFLVGYRHVRRLNHELRFHFFLPTLLPPPSATTQDDRSNCPFFDQGDPGLSYRANLAFFIFYRVLKSYQPRLAIAAGILFPNESAVFSGTKHVLG